jgi:aryl-alcohol dehydrogenase-like predicted oxidoreductase
MKYRTLGRTHLKVSVVGVGTWQFGGAWGKDFTQSEVDAILETAKDLGINVIDTAECYGPHLSEQLIGGYLQRLQNRSHWVIATKFGHRHGVQNDGIHYWLPASVLQELEDSLRSLQTDYIDLYQFHSGSDEVFDNDELWTMLDKQVAAGKVRHLGISIGSNDNLHQTERATQVHAQAIQVVYNRINRAPEARVFPSCQQQNLGVLARVPLASGYLSGKYQPGASFPANDVRSQHNPERTAKILEEVEVIRDHEVPEGVAMATWALGWCLQHPAVTTVIPGCKSPQQVIDNAKASDLPMVDSDHPQAWPN